MQVQEIIIKAIKNGGPGDFDVRVTTDEGVLVESPISRREIETKVSAMSGSARRYWKAILDAFPVRSASFDTLSDFAKETDASLPSYATDASRVWESLFGETNVDIAESDGGMVALSPELAEDEAIAEEPAAATKTKPKK